MQSLNFKVTLNSYSTQELDLINHLNGFMSGKGIQARTTEIKRLMIAGLQSTESQKVNQKRSLDHAKISKQFSDSIEKVNQESLEKQKKIYPDVDSNFNLDLQKKSESIPKFQEKTLSGISELKKDLFIASETFFEAVKENSSEKFSEPTSKPIIQPAIEADTTLPDKNFELAQVSQTSNLVVNGVEVNDSVLSLFSQLEEYPSTNS